MGTEQILLKMEESAFLPPDFPDVVIERMQTLSSVGKAEPMGWICVRNAFVTFVGLGAERPRSMRIHGTPTSPPGRRRESALSTS